MMTRNDVSKREPIIVSPKDASAKFEYQWKREVPFDGPVAPEPERRLHSFMNMEIGKVSGSSSLKPLGSWIIAAALLVLALPAGAFQTEWKPSPQTLKQLVDGGYEIKGFGVHSYGPRNVEGVFVLQKAGSVYQCYEFSILKDDLTTARQSLNCFELTAPYDRQPGK